MGMDLRLATYALLFIISGPQVRAADVPYEHFMPKFMGLHSVTLASSQTVDYAFSPDAGAGDLVIKAIKSARHNIDVAAYSFTSKPIAHALIDAQRSGIPVRIILDHDQLDRRSHSEAPYLAENGLEVRIDIAHALMHDKFMVIDGMTVETGSYNYTSSAEHHNAENVLVLWNNPDLAKAYDKNWQDLWNQAEHYHAP